MGKYIWHSLCVFLMSTHTKKVNSVHNTDTTDMATLRLQGLRPIAMRSTAAVPTAKNFEAAIAVSYSARTAHRPLHVAATAPNTGRHSTAAIHLWGSFLGNSDSNSFRRRGELRAWVTVFVLFFYCCCHCPRKNWQRFQFYVAPIRLVCSCL